jgi:hypothetical protein
MTTEQAIHDLTNRAMRIWTAHQTDRDPAEWAGKTVGVDTATGEVFFGGCVSDIPTRPTVVLVQPSRVDFERRRLRLGGRWRRVR